MTEAYREIAALKSVESPKVTVLFLFLYQVVGLFPCCWKSPSGCCVRLLNVLMLGMLVCFIAVCVVSPGAPRSPCLHVSLLFWQEEEGKDVLCSFKPHNGREHFFAWTDLVLFLFVINNCHPGELNDMVCISLQFPSFVRSWKVGAKVNLFF